MKKESSIERNLLFLSAGALTIFTVFLGSFFWVQSNLADNQTHNKGVVSPVHHSTEILNSSFNELFNRQNKIATTETSVGISGLGDRQRVETQIQDAKKGLTEVLPMITSMDPKRGDEAQKILQELDQDLASFLDSDQRYYQANLKRRLQEENLAAANKKIESRLKAFLETTQGLSGKIRFTHGSSVRRAHRLVQSSGFNDEAKSLIQARILGSSNLKLSLVNEVLEAAGELNRLAARIAPASSEDQINTLIANELVQQREKAMVNIQDLRDEVRRDPELEKIASELQTSLVALTQDMMDNRNPESLVNLKFKVFAAIKEAAAIRGELERINATISTSLGQLVQTSEGLSRELDEGLSGVVARTRLILAFVLILALVAGAFGGIAVVRSVKALRKNNTDLSRLKEELIEVNGNLEKIVDERTKTIRTILDHVQFGFLLCDKNLTILEGSTQSCETLLVKSQLTGMDLPSALDMTPAQSENFAMQLSQLFEDVLPESVVFSQVPSRFTVGGRTLRLQGSAVRDESGQIVQVLYCLIDISDLESAEKTNRENRVLLNILRNPDQFRRFIADTYRSLALAKNAAVQGDVISLRRELHTIKGNMGVYELHAIAREIHQLEDQSEISVAAIDQIEKTVAAFLGANFDILGISYEEKPADSYRISDRTLLAIEECLANFQNPRSMHENLTRLVAEIKTKPAKDLMGPLDELTRSLAQRFGKALAFQVDGGAIKMDPERVLPIFNILPHLIRNSIDHGIEFPWERNGKPDEATLRVSFREDRSNWTMVIQDDGRGINTEKLQQKALAAGILRPQDRPTQAELCRMILSSNLSTTDTVSDISGRGIGMGAVAAVVSGMGCTIDVSSEAGKGTRFEIIIPKSPGAVVRPLLARVSS